MIGWEHEGPCDCAPGEGHRVDTSYCRHGTFIGDPYGPDYLCHWCEEPDGDHQYARAQLDRRRVELLGPKLDETLRAMHAELPTVDPRGPVFRRYIRLLRWGVRSHLYWYPEELSGTPCVHACDDCGLVDRHDLAFEH